jgi:hypothetical protein
MAVAKLKISMADGQLSPTSIGGKVAGATTAAQVNTFLAALAPICYAQSVFGAGLTTPLAITTIEGDTLGENERSKKWAIVCENSMGFKETHYVTCADFTIVTGSDILPIDAGVGQTFAAAFEALFVDSNEGALTVLKIFKARS